MKLYGLIGYPLSHSFSKTFFNDFFSSKKINAKYVNYEIEDINALRLILEENKDLVGLNVTIPHKVSIIPFLDKIDDSAQNIGAVNVVKILKNEGKVTLHGYNSDIFGFVESLKPFLMPHHNKALILGTGGASMAVAKGLDSLNIRYSFVSRFPKEKTITYNDLNKDIISKTNIIVNCTPLGTYPNMDSCPPIPYKHLNKQHLLYDLVYNPAKTKFLRHGEKQGCQTTNGANMLKLQALKAYSIWDTAHYL
ncbi:MAG: shikimate dehydrogenase family protein [Bacteroidales bacterium]